MRHESDRIANRPASTRKASNQTNAWINFLAGFVVTAVFFGVFAFFFGQSPQSEPQPVVAVPVEEPKKSETVAAPPETPKKPEVVVAAPPETPKEPEVVVAAPPETPKKPEVVVAAPPETPKEPEVVVAAPPETPKKPEVVEPAFDESQTQNVFSTPPTEEFIKERSASRRFDENSPERLKKAKEILWNLPTAKLKAKMTTRKGFMPKMGQFTPDGKKLIAIGGVSNECHVFDTETGNQTAVMTYSENLDWVDVHPLNGVGIAVSGSKILHWNIESGKVFREIQTTEKYLQGFKGRVTADGFSYVSCSHTCNFRTCAVATGKIRCKFKAYGGNTASGKKRFSMDSVKSAAISSDGNLAAVCSHWETGKSGLRYYSVKIWNTSGKELHSLKGCVAPTSRNEDPQIPLLAFNQRGTVLVSAVGEEEKGTITLWDVKTGNQIKSFDVIPPPRSRFIWSPYEDFTLIISPDDSQLILDGIVWDLESCLPVYRVSELGQFGFSKDGKMFVGNQFFPSVRETMTERELIQWDWDLKVKRETAKEISLKDIPQQEFIEATVPDGKSGNLKSWERHLANEKWYVDSLTAPESEKYVFLLERRWQTLKSHYGFTTYNEKPTNPNCVFVVKGDGKEIFRSQAVKDLETRSLEMDVRNVDKLELFVENKGSNHDAIWFTPTLFRDAAPPKSETPKSETPKQETPKQETPKQETPKQETPKQKTPKPETPKPETPKQETPKQETPKQETPKQETPKQETPKQETPKQETPKQETPKQETPKQETPKPETPKSETPKSETPKPETPKPETLKREAVKKEENFDGFDLSAGSWPDKRVLAAAPTGFFERLNEIENEIQAKGGWAVAGQVIEKDGSSLKKEAYSVTVIHSGIDRFDDGWFITKRVSYSGIGDFVASGFQHETVRIPLKIANGAVKYQRVILERTSPAKLTAFQGRVQNETGLPVAEARVELTVSSGFDRVSTSTVTDSEGRYSFSGITPQTYGLRVTSKQYPGSLSFGSVYAEGDKTKLMKPKGWNDGLSRLEEGKVITTILTPRRVIIDSVYQPDGSTDFTGKNVLKDRYTLVLFGAMARGEQKTGQRICFDPSKTSNSHDLILHFIEGKYVFVHSYGDSATRNGRYDLGEVDFDSVKEADPAKIRLESVPCELNHVYVIRTYGDQHYAKFVVRSIEIVKP